MNWKIWISALAFLSACATQKTAIHPVTQLHFIGAYTVPYDMQLNGTTVGGLSGIDFDAGRNLYYMICDDGTKINPARYYTAKISISSKGIDSVAFVRVTTLLQPDGSIYPKAGVDPEAMRYDPESDRLIWSSEGERTLSKEGNRLVDPFVHVASLDGNFIDSFYLPSNMHMNVSEKGPRNNGSFEGIALGDKHHSVFVSMEEPLFEDGPRAGLKDSTAWIRIIKFGKASRNPLAQYAYKLDAVAHPANPAGGFKINGISDIMLVGENKLLVVERSFSTGYPNNTIKLYLADVANATDISALPSLQAASIKPASKQLLFNMDSLGFYIDNIEGVTLGPQLPNGHQSLVFVADNNFSSSQKTQFLLFDLGGR